MAKTKTVEVIDCKINPNLNGLIIDSVKITSNKKSIRTGGTDRKPKRPTKISKLDLILSELQSHTKKFDILEADINDLKDRMTNVENKITVLESK